MRIDETPFTVNPTRSKVPSLWSGYVGGFAPFSVSKECYNPATNRYPVKANGSAYSITDSPIGRAIYWTGNASQEWAAATANPFKFASETPITIQAMFKYVHQSSTKEFHIFKSDNSTIGIPAPYGWGLYVEPNLDKLVFFTDRGNAGDVPHGATWDTTNSSLSQNTWYHAIVTWDAYESFLWNNFDYATFYINGLQVSQARSATERLYIHHSSLVSRSGASFGQTTPDFGVSLVGIWSRHLSYREIDCLSADPLAMFRPMRRIIGRSFGRITKNTRQTMNVRPGVGFQTLRGRS